MKRKPTSRRVVALSSLVALAVVALGAGAGHSALGGGSQAGVLVSGTTDSITNIDPAGNYDYGTFSLDINMYEHLYDAKNGAKLVPSLATGCAPRGNTRTWRCTLRRGVKFHDGSDFDSADVKFSFDRVSNAQIVKQAAANTPSSLLSNLKSVTTNGRYAVTFNLKAPASTWPFILATGAAGIVPSDAYKGNSLQGNDQPQIGTGPYRLTRYTPGQQAVFEPFDDYWGPQARNDGLILRYYSKSSTMKLALQRGEIDMAFQTFTPTELASLGEARNIRVHQGQGAIIRYLVMNVERAAVRQRERATCPRLHDAAAGDRIEGLSRNRQAALLDAARGASRAHRRVRFTLRSRPEHRGCQARVAASRCHHTIPDRDLVDADALRRRVGGRVRRDEARSRERWRVQGDSQVV